MMGNGTATVLILGADALKGGLHQPKTSQNQNKTERPSLETGRLLVTKAPVGPYIPVSSLSLGVLPSDPPAPSPTTWAVACLLATWVTRILPCQPCFAPATKMTKPSIFAMPSPRLLISEIVTSYSFPTSTGFGLKDLNPPPAPPPPPLRPYPPLPKLVFSHPSVSFGTAEKCPSIRLIKRYERKFCPLLVGCRGGYITDEDRTCCELQSAWSSFSGTAPSMSSSEIASL